MLLNRDFHARYVMIITMNLLTSRPLFFTFSILITIAAYYASLYGGPIWDDNLFHFHNNVITDDFSYLTLFLNFAWPMSVMTQKILYQILHENYFAYHLINLFLHLLNAYLFYKILEKLHLPYPRMGYLLFLLHPANVLSVSWIIQLKTVMCFCFAALSFLALIRAFEDKRFWPLSWFFFLLSILSKSASIPLPVVFLVYTLIKKGKAQVLWMIPFFIIMLYSGYKILKSDVTTLGTLQHKSKTYVPEEDEMGVVRPVQPPVKTVVTPTQKDKTTSLDVPSLNRVQMVLKATYYYFWQVILPLENYPVKGQGNRPPRAQEFLHVIFLVALIFLTRKNLLCLILIGGYVMLTPFLGIIIAPYMNLTWVSDQHLYLALPFFLVFCLGLISKAKSKFVHLIPISFLLFFGIQTYRASHYYKNEIIFYSKSLEADSTNLPIAYNLAASYIRQNDLQSAILVTGKVIHEASENKKIKNSKYFPYITRLHGKLIKATLHKP